MAVSGFAAEGFEPVRRAFEESFSSDGEVGAAFAAMLDGRPVVDLWGGAADLAANAPWREDTLQIVFSGTKGFVALCMLMLIERGQLDLEQPVARYWPEFAAAGKDGVLVRHVVSHEAGLPGFREPISHDDLVDDGRMAALLAAQAPFWPAGEHVCYHGVTYGWLCGELVRRVDGRSVGTFFAEEVAGPLGLELWIGLPEEHEPRVSVLAGSLASPPEPVEGFEEAARLVAGNPPLFVGLPACWNSRAYHAAEIPGAGAIGTARSIARLYGCLAGGGELDGVRVLRPETVELGRCLSRGTDACFGWPLAFGVGFALQNDERDFGPREGAFGHCGAGGSAHGAWPEAGVGFSYAMNELRDDMSRSGALLTALDEALTAAGR
jgi:CubicO group peptidase (beta-lactamase class C family)